MSDIATIWDGTGGDWQLSGADLGGGDDLATAVMISLFTDARAAADDTPPDGSGDPRGWWGDEGEDVPIGSRLWLRERSKRTPETLSRIHDDVVAALKWLIDDGVADAVDVSVDWLDVSGPIGGVAFAVVIHRNSGPQPVRFDWAWGAVS